MTTEISASPEINLEAEQADTQDKHAHWAGVVSMSLGVFALVTAEFLPASLLTPMASGLQISEGAAGQAVTATAIVALVTSLLISVVIGALNRRLVLIGFSLLLIVSNLIVAAAPGLTTILVGRILLGVALGGFWTLSTATVMRLVPTDAVPRALAIVFMGVSAATVVAVPVGSYLGALIGWRGVFVAASGLGVVAALIQFATLPSLPARNRRSLNVLLDVMRRPGIGIGMLAVLLVFAGHFTFFTYIRPFLEDVTHVQVAGVTAILFAFGIANFIGTYLVAYVIEHSLRFALLLMPMVMVVLALSLSAFGGIPALDAALIAIWGLVFAGVPVSWSTWITRTLSDEAETGGGLIVAAINLAIAIGAGFGGFLLETVGSRGVFAASGAICLIATVIILARVKAK
ncbi:MFS transporter [Paracoccus xiamenensis]|uniref:MFS transporter n=1 Tax=Paracoccus xiamenensis TaxID=2714901 RepID=UPI00140955BC|nr:MFS transporter [Paracoccus xiamenensis]NHF72572.1 MFS transporter [Paracoccus xiamenensis]